MCVCVSVSAKGLQVVFVSGGVRFKIVFFVFFLPRVAVHVAPYFDVRKRKESVRKCKEKLTST